MSLIEQLRARGVRIHSEHGVVLEDIDPDRFEAGVEVYPGCTIRGRASCFGAGTKLGKAGGGYFSNVQVGRGVDLYGGVFSDCTILDGVTVRGHAELRGGTLMEEGSEAAHHVGYKMTIMFPFVVAGSLINLCDALFAGGTSRKDHSEIGSCLALYNFTPWGDKFASQFGDVPSGVFLRSPRIFLGGQTQVVSPVSVGYGAVVPAGCAVRRSIPAGRIAGQVAQAIDAEFDPVAYGGLAAKFALTCRYVGNLRALEAWYAAVREPAAADAFTRGLYAAGRAQVSAGIAERIKRLAKIVDKLPASIARHEVLGASGDRELHARRATEHATIVQTWPSLHARLSAPWEDAVDTATGATLERLAAALGGEAAWTDKLAALDDAHVAEGSAALERIVAAYSTDGGVS